MRRTLTLIAIAAAALSVAACSQTSVDVSNEVAAYGIHDVVSTGYAPFVCGKDDSLETGFTGVNAAGQRVSGVVCSGFLTKGATLRNLRIEGEQP